MICKVLKVVLEKGLWFTLFPQLSLGLVVRHVLTSSHVPYDELNSVYRYITGI